MAENLLEASKDNDIDLLKEMKKVKLSKSKGQTMPKKIDGETEPSSERNMKLCTIQQTLLML